jgi:iron complex transport system substrate-binding protein
VKRIIMAIAMVLIVAATIVPVQADQKSCPETAGTYPQIPGRPVESTKTLIDSSGKTFVFRNPIKRVVPLSVNSFEVLRTLKATDLIVGVSVHIVDDPFYYPGFQDYPSIGERFAINHEMLLLCHPDLVITSTTTNPADLDDKLIGTDIAVVRFDFNNLETYTDEIRRLADLLNKKEAADAYLEFFHAKMDATRSVIDRIPAKNRPTVFLEADFGGGKNYMTCGNRHTYHQLLVAAGGENVFSHVNFYSEISPEAVLNKNPQIIMKYKYPGGHINMKKEQTEDLEAVREEILSRSELVNVDAVKNNRVYILDWYSSRGGAQYFLCLAQLAKWLYPEQLKELHPRADYAEYLKKFQGLDINLGVYGVFFYPEQ